jgi:hypothetical protein
VEITGGLSEGSRVITTGALALRDGDPIQLPTQRGPAGAGARNQPPDQSR